MAGPSKQTLKQAAARWRKSPGILKSELRRSLKPIVLYMQKKSVDRYRQESTIGPGRKTRRFKSNDPKYTDYKAKLGLRTQIGQLSGNILTHLQSRGAIKINKKGLTVKLSAANGPNVTNPNALVVKRGFGTSRIRKMATYSKLFLQKKGEEQLFGLTDTELKSVDRRIGKTIGRAISGNRRRKR